VAPQPVPMPERLRPVLALANTVDVEDGTDVFDGGPAALGRWLSDHGLAPPDVRPTAAHLRLARDLRSGLRALLLANNGGVADPDDLAAGERAMARLPLVAATHGPALRPAASDPVLVGLSAIVVGYVEAVASGCWHRLRRCPAEDCAWAFWDSSAKAGRRWCTMRVCGNRAKVRAYAARRRTTAARGA